MFKKQQIDIKSQQRFKSEKHDVFTDKVSKIALCANDDRRIKSIDSIEACTCGTNKEIIHKKEEIKYINIINQYEKRIAMMMLQKKIWTNII